MNCLGEGFCAALQVTTPIWYFKKALSEWWHLYSPVSCGFGTRGKHLCGSIWMNSGFPYIWHPFFSIFSAQKSLGDDVSGTHSMGDPWCHLFQTSGGTMCSHAAACVLLWPEPPEALSCQHVFVYFLSGNKILFYQKKERTKRTTQRETNSFSPQFFKCDL